MDRRWGALLAALLAAHGVLRAAASDEPVFHLTAAAESGYLAAAALSLETGVPLGAEDWLALLPAGEAEPILPPTPSPSPQPTETPGPTPSPEPTPSPTSAETPAPKGDEPETDAVVLPFTDTPGVEIKNNTGFSVDIAALMEEELPQRLPGSGPQILIIHTHGTEAYLPMPGEAYDASDPYRTTDAAHSVIRVGDVLAEELEKYGLRVVHDRGLYDYPSYAGSYARSGAAAERWLAEYPGIAVVIDLHRDAVGTEDVIYKTCALVSGPQAAQVMLVVGTGENGLEHPNWRDNLKLALALQAAADSLSPTLTRPIHLAPERYNQHLTAGSLILEVGTNGNTLSEAERAARLFAAAAGPLLASLVETE